jgi:pre-mRNA-splicing factor CDC5/CEF1
LILRVCLNFVFQFFSTPSSTLLGAYKDTPAARADGNPLRTPARTPLGKQQALLNEARNLAILSSGATPLMGDQNLPLAPTTFTGGVTPKQLDIRTPNPLATPSRIAAMTTPRGMMTPGTPASIVGRTPVRDAMGINSSDSIDHFSSERQQALAIREQVRAGLASLPQPVNEYGAEMPADEDDEEGAVEDVPMDVRHFPSIYST